MKGKSTYYHVYDNTFIQNISLRDFLSDIRTNGELTEYLADKIVIHSKNSNNSFKRLMATSRAHTKNEMLIFRIHYSLIVKKKQTLYL